MKKKISLIVLAIVALTFLLTNPVPTQAATPTPEKIKWVGQAHVPNSLPFFKYFKHVADRITAASNGRLQLSVYAAGAMVPATKEFDGVSKGIIDFGLGGFTFWVDKWPAAALFASVCGHMTPMQKYLWFAEGGGLELLQKMVKDHNVHFTPGIGLLNPAEIFLQTSSPIKNLADLKKLKIRAIGDGAAILARMGVSIVFMSGGQVYESAARKIIDGFELDSFRDLSDGKLYEVIKYAYMSPVRSPHELIPIFYNKKKFDALPEDLKIIVESITQEETFRYYTDTLYGQAAIRAELQKKGLVIGKLPADIETAFINEAKNHYSELAAKDALAKEVLDSLNKTSSILHEVQPEGQ